MIAMIQTEKGISDMPGGSDILGRSDTLMISLVLKAYETKAYADKQIPCKLLG